MNNYKVGQIYKVGLRGCCASSGDLIQISGIENGRNGKCVQYQNLEHGYLPAKFRVGSDFDLGLSLEYPRNFENSKEDKTKSKTDSEIEITIKINKTETIATLEIDGVHKETIDAEDFETEDFLYSVVDVFVDRINNPVSLYNGKVVCIDPCACEDIYTLGKIYEFKDGHMQADDGCVVPPIDEEGIADFEEWQEFSSAKWVEVVE